MGRPGVYGKLQYLTLSRSILRVQYQSKLFGERLFIIAFTAWLCMLLRIVFTRWLCFSSLLQIEDPLLVCGMFSAAAQQAF